MCEPHNSCLSNTRPSPRIRASNQTEERSPFAKRSLQFFCFRFETKQQKHFSSKVFVLFHWFDQENVSSLTNQTDRIFCQFQLHDESVSVHKLHHEGKLLHKCPSDHCDYLMLHSLGIVPSPPPSFVASTTMISDRLAINH